MQLVTEFIIPLMSIVQHVSSVMSLIIRNLNCIWASGLQMLVEPAHGAVWVGIPTQMAPRAVSTSVCKPEAQIQLRFLMMSDITLDTCWTIDISGIINSVTSCILLVFYFWTRFGIASVLFYLMMEAEPSIEALSVCLTKTIQWKKVTFTCFNLMNTNVTYLEIYFSCG
jgi:hypothetical protein